MTASLFKLILVTQLVLTFQTSRANTIHSNFTIKEVNTTNIVETSNSSLIVEEVNSTYTGCFDDSCIQNVISSIYKNDFGNFEKAFNFTEFGNDTNFKAYVLLGLYNAMANAHHTDSPNKTMTLYVKIEDFIREESRLLSYEQLHKLQRIREEILLRTIVPRGAHMLAQNFFINGFNQENTKLKRLLEVLQINSTVFSLTIEHMIKKNSWLPRLELINLLSSLSQSAEQNVDSLLLLNDIFKFEGDEYHVFSSRLIPLNLWNPIDAERKRRIDAVIPRPLHILLAGCVSFYQLSAEKIRLYISGIRNSNRMFLSHGVIDVAVFKVEIKRKPLTYNFVSMYFDNQPMYLKLNETEGKNNSKFDPYILDPGTVDDTDMVDIEWKVQIGGEQVTLQNWDGTIFLCLADKTTTKERFYTTNQAGFALHPEECKWYVESCYPKLD